MRITLHTEDFSGASAHATLRARFLASLFCAAILWLAPETLGQKPRSTAPPRASKTSSPQAVSNSIPLPVMMRIVRAEDERRWDADLAALLTDNSAPVRRRAALAAGRIGDEQAVLPLIALMRGDADMNVRAMAAFALGETESATGAEALVESLLRENNPGEIRARVIEAIGKVAAALPKEDKGRALLFGLAITKALNAESLRPVPDRMVVLEGLTAVLRAQSADANLVVPKFLRSADARIRADAANTLTRLRARGSGDQLRALLQQDANAIVRANAARALGAAEDHAAFDVLADKSVNDADERVRVSAIRALGSLKDKRAADVLLARAASLFALYRARRSSGVAFPSETNELLEIATTLGRALANTNDARASVFLRALREAELFHAPEPEIALASIKPANYLREAPFKDLANERTRAILRTDWRAVASLSQALSGIAKLTSVDAGNSAPLLQAEAQTILRTWIEDSLSAVGLPDALRALASFKPKDMDEVLRRALNAEDVMVRATAAELLGDLDATNTATNSAANSAGAVTAHDADDADALAAALPMAMRDEMNDAALAILDALAKHKTSFTNDTIKTALASSDHLLRRRAAALLKANNAGDYSARIGTVATRNTVADYTRSLARGDRVVRAVVVTDKGKFSIELLPQDAPLTVDSFVRLARRGFFDHTDFHRVVPNFVIQGGDPRGDGNGGPGYQIRCEINEAVYDRGAVGMALSGKDTGGSQWFVTHSPQPHLDGGYTVFGRVIEGMDVVDRIARGDRIRRVTITEGNEARNALPSSRTAPAAKNTTPRRKRTAP